MRQPKPRLHYLDALRGLAAMTVMFSHFTDEVREQYGFSGAELGFANIVASLNLGKYGVVLFFLISGYIIPNSLGATGDRIGRFCVSRFFRLYPLYWLTLSAAIFLPPTALIHAITVPLVLANATMAQGYLHQPDIIGSAWTLQIELTFYGFCVLIAAMHRMRDPQACAIASLIFLAAAIAMAIARNLLAMKLPVALPLALSLMFFGTIWRQAMLTKIPLACRIAPWLLGVITLSIAPISLLAYNRDYGLGDGWQSYTIGYLLAILTFVLFTTRVLLLWRPLVWLGEISYSIYLLHPLVLTGAQHTGLTARASPLDPYVYVGCQMAIALLVSWATYRLVEQPFVRIGHRVVRDMARPASAEAAAGATRTD